MTAAYTFKGRLEFADADVLADAINDTEELLSSEDEDLVALANASWDTWFVQDGASLTVDLTVEGPEGYWFALEAAIETLTEAADSGEVVGRDPSDDFPRKYPAGGGGLDDEEDEDAPLGDIRADGGDEDAAGRLGGDSEVGLGSLDASVEDGLDDGERSEASLEHPWGYDDDDDDGDDDFDEEPDTDDFELDEDTE